MKRILMLLMVAMACGGSPSGPAPMSPAPPKLAVAPVLSIETSQGECPLDRRQATVFWAGSHTTEVWSVFWSRRPLGGSYFLAASPSNPFLNVTTASSEAFGLTSECLFSAGDVVLAKAYDETWPRVEFFVESGEIP